MTTRPVRAAIFATAFALAACGSSSATEPVPGASTLGATSAQGALPNGVIVPGASYHPAVDASRFRAVVDNPWFPLRPGTTFTYAGTKDGKPSRDVYTVTGRTRTIAGVPCVVVDDRLYLAGKLEERTTDYYTQDLDGNVWYFGEDTAELDASGKVTTTEGTWHAGSHGAQPGLFMEANPVVGHAFRQEYDRGNAEDQFEVVSLDAPVTVPFGSFPRALLTKETTAVEPGVVDHKYYVSGVGEVAELSVTGPPERARLVAVDHR